MSNDAISIEPYNGDYGEQIVDLILGIQRDEFGLAITIEDQPDLMAVDTKFYHLNIGAMDGNGRETSS